MSTLKLKKTAGRSAAAKTTDPRAPVRGAGAGVKKRPTLAQKQAVEASRDTPRRSEPKAPAAMPAPAKRTMVERPAASRPPAQRPAAQPPTQRQEARRPAPRRNTAFGDSYANADKPVAPRRTPQRPQQSQRGQQQEEPVDNSMRLSKRMSELGIASRREADEWIPKGWVRVDGKVISELGSRVRPGQHITIEAKARDAQAMKVTVLINKPVGFVSGQAEDGHEPAVVLVNPRNQWREDRSGIRFLPLHLRSLAPAGRLDIDSVGLLVLTQDGRVAKQLVGEDSEIDKEYLVRVRTLSGLPLPHSQLALLRHGLSLDGEALKPAQVEWVNDDQLRFVLHEGKKRQIRRMCEAVGLEVLGLKRVRIGGVTLGQLPPGQWRYLRGNEKFDAPPIEEREIPGETY